MNKKGTFFLFVEIKRRYLDSVNSSSQKSVTTQSIDSCMNFLISKYDKVENNSEMENLIFELHSLKNRQHKRKKSRFDERKTSVPSTILKESPMRKSRVPLKLRK